MKNADVKHKNIVLPILIAVLALAITTGFLFYNAGRYLVINEEPIQSDVILVFAGDKGQRTEKAVSLYKDNYSSKLILSGGSLYNNITSAELMYDHAVREGVKAEDLILEPEADSTYENAVFCRRIMEERKYQSALVISSEYHMRRVRLSCEKAFQGSSIRLVYCPADEPQYEPESWWANNKSMLWTVTEYLKIMGYELGLTS